MKNTLKSKFILVLGGARSGKINFAERFAANISENVANIVTAPITEEEMVRRNHIYKVKRPGHWVTYEETRNIVQLMDKLKDEPQVILLDCLTSWLSNLLINSTTSSTGISWPDKENYILKEVEKLGRLTENSLATIIVVANEVSWGLVPDNRLGKAFRDVAGAANQILAQYADEVYLIVAGIPIEIKSLAIRQV
ncbi:bifunctional adenosylcobinamide kinase/adenosylcobinamide-phosphate guanylyltransferase [Peptococcaceae bacterium 1198_IL3148]